MDFITVAKKRISENTAKLRSMNHSLGGLFIVKSEEDRVFYFKVMCSENEMIFAISSDEFACGRYIDDNYLILKNLLEDNGIKVFVSVNDWRKSLAA